MMNKFSLFCLAAMITAAASPAAMAQLWVGGATVSITPEQPVALSGQRRVRIARTVETPCTATALAIESRDQDGGGDHAILVSCDLVAIRDGIVDEVRECLGDKLEGFDTSKLILNATHTHTAPVMIAGRYAVPKEGVMQPEDYRKFLVQRIAEVTQAAWEARQPGKVGWGLGYAVVAHNRRVAYRDGSAQMYGNTNRDDFVRIEGYEDHGVEVLCFWNQDDTLIATAINVACPSQEVEGRSAVNADFWHQVREGLQAKHGEELFVLGWTGASGDQSPRPMYRKAAEERMRKLRGAERLDDIARRIIAAWEEAYQGASQERHDDPLLIHHVDDIELPMRMVTEQEAEAARTAAERYADNPAEKWNYRWNQQVVERFEQQSPDDTYTMPLHAIRIGDVAIATNDFELFTEFGVRIKARSPALQTFLIQLAGSGAYVPTEPATAGGGYSAVVQSSRVGHEGGTELVEQTVAALNALWDDPQ